MINVLVTGGKGQLGTEIKKLEDQYPEFNFFFTDIDDLDLTSEESVARWFNLNQPRVVLNCAAYTAVDKAEDDRELAMLVNKTSVGYLAKQCNRHKALLIHISTDYVFDGTNHKPYNEGDPTRPISFYGLTKLEGEVALQQIADRYVIIRTSWLYSAHGNNFVKTMLRLGRERESLGVVVDQVGTPTYARDLAEAVLKTAQTYGDEQVKEVFHYSNEGAISWYDFAKAIMEEAHLNCQIKALESKEYPTKTNRPFYSVLNKTKIKTQLKLEVPHWRESLRKMIIELD